MTQQWWLSRRTKPYFWRMPMDILAWTYRPFCLTAAHPEACEKWTLSLGIKWQFVPWKIFSSRRFWSSIIRGKWKLYTWICWTETEQKADVRFNLLYFVGVELICVHSEAFRARAICSFTFQEFKVTVQPEMKTHSLSVHHYIDRNVVGFFTNYFCVSSNCELTL